MTLELRRDHFPVSVASARLAVTKGPDIGKEIRWGEGKVVVGTAHSCDLRLSDPTISRRHCVIQVGPKGAWIRDLSSTNGTQVEHYNVRSAYLKSGSLLSIGHSRLQFETSPVPNDNEARDRFGLLIGRSQPMRDLFERIGRFAAGSTTLLLQGETGTGKELVAETVHNESHRRRMAFVVFDCARVTRTLIESELFGHVRGAFTGARSSRPGVFEVAQGGTVFLDEIGELPLDVQPKLLRVLDRQQVTRVGASRPREVDVRVIAATNRDLRSAVEAGTFRADLFYRLNVVTLKLPPLRERGGDIELLATHFLRQLDGDPQAVIPTELVTQLNRHTWPGNVRELRNAIERWTLIADQSRKGTTSLDGGTHCAGPIEPVPRASRMDREQLNDLARLYDLSLRSA